MSLSQPSSNSQSRISRVAGSSSRTAWTRPQPRTFRAMWNSSSPLFSQCLAIQTQYKVSSSDRARVRTVCRHCPCEAASSSSTDRAYFTAPRLALWRSTTLAKPNRRLASSSSLCSTIHDWSPSMQPSIASRPPKQADSWGSAVS